MGFSSYQMASSAGLQIIGNIDVLKELQMEIAALQSGERLELSSKFQDLFLNIETLYQQYYNLDENNYGYK